MRLIIATRISERIIEVFTKSRFDLTFGDVAIGVTLIMSSALIVCGVLWFLNSLWIKWKDKKNRRNKR